ncbi:hypothetical protein AL755_04240 [Arthrobacter sp. ERGS1:01]|uniref:hypothetical protein n=1 Tax=Arthrobacter sp. ERGS1:01 TaxID=1704044 RepID=UPI0006B4194F|nr:hypothetical protein [Arthrobacter sp. ERGS1:01]ALE04892.1 hypothetical protein AL755_04240 [Arthrobacter sp. ERGS1:01]
MMKTRRGTVKDGPTTDATQLNAEWINLVCGEDVALGLANGYTLQGQVSAVATDGSAVWIDLSDGRGRQMYCATDNVTITPIN